LNYILKNVEANMVINNWPFPWRRMSAMFCNAST
jgi:hypothetical protein